MRPIVKGPEPRCLAQHRARKSSQRPPTYENLPEGCTQSLRTALVRDQRGLCCYCMDRVTAAAAALKIEHRVPRSRSPELGLAWRNLFGACTGGSAAGKPARLSSLHCDAHKGDSDITVDPLRESGDESIYYFDDGRISSSDDQVHRDLCETLNLNAPLLRERRAAAMAAALDGYERRFGSGEWAQDRVRREIARLLGQPSFEPFLGMIIWWLRRRARDLPESARRRARPCPRCGTAD